MTDFFALLGQTRSPWLDEEVLKRRFLELSAAFHPDRVQSSTDEEKQAANRRYAELNGAFNCLRDPKDRLLHLLELETGGKPAEVQRIPPGTMDLFVEVGQICRDADGFLQKKREAVSPLLKVRVFREGAGWTEKLMSLQGRINARREDLMNELKSISDRSQTEEGADKQPQIPHDRLEQIYRTLSYISRWSSQIQDRLVQISE